MPRRKRASRAAPARGTVHPLLDLHGLTGDEAVRRTESWLRARQAENTRTVVVVTGRGLRSAGPPVLPGEVSLLLDRLRGSVVSAYATEAYGGSFRVELRGPSAAPAPPAPPPEPAVLRRAPAALRQRAEEALWELGVTPTPALLAAEIRRLMDAGNADGN